jgi:hypothetical protein
MDACFFPHFIPTSFHRTSAKDQPVALVQFLIVQGFGPQDVYHALHGVVHPFLNLGWRQIKRPNGLCYRGLVLNDIHDQHCFPLGRLAFDFIHVLSCASLKDNT